MSNIHLMVFIARFPQFLFGSMYDNTRCTVQTADLGVRFFPTFSSTCTTSEVPAARTWAKKKQWHPTTKRLAGLAGQQSDIIPPLGVTWG